MSCGSLLMQDKTALTMVNLVVWPLRLQVILRSGPSCYGKYSRHL